MLMSANIANHLFRGGGRDRWRIFGALSIVQFWCPALSLVFGLRWVRDSARVFTQMLFSVSCYFLDHGGLLLTPRSWQYLDCYQETERQLRQFCFKVRGWGGLGYGWGSGKSGISIKSFLYRGLKKKKKKNLFRPANSHEDPNLTMHWHRQMGNVAG